MQYLIRLSLYRVVTIRILLERKPVGKISLRRRNISIGFAFLYRARTEQFGGAWCPLHEVSFQAHEWLEINFGNLTYLTQVETQGRFDNGQGKEYADYYLLKYTRSENSTDEFSWIEYKPRNRELNSTWIRANRNTYMGEIRLLGRRLE